MKKALMIAPAASVFQKFCKVNIECLKEAGYEIYLASNYSDADDKKQKKYDAFREWCEKENIRTIDIKFARKSLLKNMKMIKIVKNLIKENDFDLIHCHTETGGLITACALNRKCSAKKIYTPHGISFYKGSSILSWLLFYPLEKWICGKMDKVIALNNEEYEIISGWENNETKLVHGIGLDVKSISEIGCDKEQIREMFGIKSDDFFIICVGELNENKNHKIVIDAVSKLNRDDIKCVICGVGHLKEKLQEMIENLELNDKITLAGYRTDIPILLNAADVLSFPSFHEGLPVSVMEAMAAGLPVVCSEIRGNVDLIQNEVGGFLFKPTDSEAIKVALDKLINDRLLREKMGETNKNNIRKFDSSEVKKEIYDVYTNWA